MRAVCFSVALAACAMGVAHAQQAPGDANVMGGVYACANITEPQARLACFDSAVAALKTAEARGEFAAVDANRVRQIERDAFGFSLPSLPRLGLPGRRDAEEEQIQTQVMKIARRGRFEGKPSFTMENGQVWVVLEGRENRNLLDGAEVTIRRASLGSYLLSAEKGGPAQRVRRAQ